MSAKAKRIAHCIADFFVNRCTDRIIQITLFIRYFIAYGFMEIAVLNFLYAGDKFYGSCCSQKVADHRFGRVDL